MLWKEKNLALKKGALMKIETMACGMFCACLAAWVRFILRK
jgi:hypothetical protein